MAQTEERTPFCLDHIPVLFCGGAKPAWHKVGMGDEHPSRDRPQGTLGWLQWQEAVVTPGPRGTPAAVVSQGEGLIADVDEGFILFHCKNTSKLHTKR